MTIQLLLGLAISALPFLLLLTNKRLNATTLVVAVIGLHTAIALTTQLVGIFNYRSVLIAHGAIITAAIVLKRQHVSAISQSLRNYISTPRRLLQHMDPIALVVVVIAAIYLGSVHYNYTGLITTATQPEYQSVTNYHYPYPYYADEWYSIAFIQHSITTGNLPIRNPLTEPPQPFPNLEAATHSLLAEVVVLLGLDPLTHYVPLTIAANTGIILLLYSILRRYRVHQAPAAFAALGALFIISSANLPGLWTLIPLTLGLISYLLTLASYSGHHFRTAALAALLTLLFYPPLILFLVPVWASAVFTTSQPIRMSRHLLITASTTVVAALLVYTFFALGQPDHIPSVAASINHILKETILYQNFTPGAIPRYTPYVVIPPLILSAALVGAWPLIKQRRWELLGALTIGITLWFVYSQTTWRLIIGQQRAIIVTSLLAVIAAGFGFDSMWRYGSQFISGKRAGRWYQYGTIIGTLLLFLVLLPTYTSRTDWQKLVLVYQEINQELAPSAPANRYLHPDDLRLFEPLQHQRFLSLPWKGTVVGAATNNIPAATKTGTISQHSTLTNRFIQATCPDKQRLSKQHRLNYVYLPSFNCPGFSPTATSAEDLTLYRVHGPATRARTP